MMLGVWRRVVMRHHAVMERAEVMVHRFGLEEAAAGVRVVPDGQGRRGQQHKASHRDGAKCDGDLEAKPCA